LKDINLLPDDMRKKDSHEESRGRVLDFRDQIDPKVMWIGFIVLFALTVVFFFPFLYNKHMEQQVKRTVSEINSEKFDRVREVNKGLKEIQDKVAVKQQVVGVIDQSSVPVHEIFVAIQSIMPSNSVINNVNFDGRKVTLSGRVAENIQLGEIISRAKRSNYFHVDERAAISYNDSKNFTFNFELFK
jgi:hypothetical protein